jgi:catechol 2,3-dioxygenase-like lactoylglutathione lyase family enzyme
MITSVARIVVLCRSAAERRTFWEALGFEQVFQGQTPQGQPLLHLGLPSQPGVALWLIEAESRPAGARRRHRPHVRDPDGNVVVVTRLSA